MAKMAVEIGGKDYLLELDRKELRYLDSIGFSFERLTTNPPTQVALFWAGAMHKNQPKLHPSLAVELLDKYLDEGGELDEITEFLTEQYKTFSKATQVDTEKKKPRVIE